jgi:acyl carrier protein
MGLDTVELLIEVEECFGVAITDESAAQLTTPRQLASHVAKLLAAQSPEGRSAKANTCLSQRAFYRLRRALIAETGLSRNALRPDTPLAEVFPDQRRAAWRRLRRALASPDLPRLKATSRINAITQTIFPTLSALLAIYLALSPWSILAAAIAGWYLSLAACDRLGTQFPSGLKTLGDLAPYIPVEPPTVWREGEILQQVRLLTARQSGLSLDLVDPDAHFIHDIGLD